ncbi:MAG: glycosyltransferase family 2 protein [Acidimicrobiales bacterium]
MPNRATSHEAVLPWGLNAAQDAETYQRWLEVSGPAEARTSAKAVGDVTVIVLVEDPDDDTIRRCLTSVIEQTMAAPEVLLCVRGDTAGLPTTPAMHFVPWARDLDVAAILNEALSNARGRMVLFLDGRGWLHPDALRLVSSADGWAEADLLYADEDCTDASGLRHSPSFKPAWSEDILLSYNYLGRALWIDRERLVGCGGFTGDGDHDLTLRVTEGPCRIVHVPIVLYHQFSEVGGCVVPAAQIGDVSAVERALARRGVVANVVQGQHHGQWSVRRRILGHPTVTVIIPYRDNAKMTWDCIESLQGTRYESVQVILVDNGSVEPESLALRKHLTDHVTVMTAPGEFNWSSVNNEAAAVADGDFLLFLNNDVTAQSNQWLEALVELAQRDDVGAVGGLLRLAGGQVQHAGIVLGLTGIAGHIFAGLPPDKSGYHGWDGIIRPYSAVTGACLMTRKSVFEDLGGFDTSMAVAFNDVDYCLRVRESGRLVLFTPHSEFLHHESVTRGRAGYVQDYQYFLRRWPLEYLQDDRWYSPHLSRQTTWASLRWPDEDQEWIELIQQLAP